MSREETDLRDLRRRRKEERERGQKQVPLAFFFFLFVDVRKIGVSLQDRPGTMDGLTRNLNEVEVEGDDEG